MKLFFMSDIHGSLHYLRFAVQCFENEKADFIILLGDALYHGPRNKLPEGYNPSESAEVLNSYRYKIIAVRGNCDSEVDQMLITYPMMSDYSTILFNGRRLFLTHGHLYSPENMPPLREGDIFLYGHTHIPNLQNRHGIYIINPGSISLPKQGYPNTYGILDNEYFILKNLNGIEIMRIQIK